MHTYFIEQVDKTWRVIIFEHDEETGARSVFRIEQSADLLSVADVIEDLDYLEDIRGNIEDLPEPFRSRALFIRKRNHLEYIRDCHQAVADAERELKARKAELDTAIQGAF